ARGADLRLLRDDPRRGGGGGGPRDRHRAVPAARDDRRGRDQPPQVVSGMAKLIWLLPILPLLGVAVNGTLGGRLGKRGVGAVACGTVLLAFLLSCGAVWELSQLPEEGRLVTASLG